MEPIKLVNKSDKVFYPDDYKEKIIDALNEKIWGKNPELIYEHSASSGEVSKQIKSQPSVHDSISIK